MLKLIKFIRRNGNRKICLYKCSCGKEKEIREDAVKCGNTKSCGCLQLKFAKSGKAHLKHGMSYTRFWSIWSDIKRRTNNKKRIDYNRYGGRGINICLEWLDFNKFYKDMFKSYLNHIKKFGEKNTTIDRIDNNGNYCKDNCRWSTCKEQSNNTRRNKFIIYKGEKLTYTQWEEKLDLKEGTISRKIISGKNGEILIKNVINKKNYERR